MCFFFKLGTHEVFDNIVFPSTENHPNVIVKLWGKLMSAVSSSSEKSDQLVILDHNSMQVLCLKIYLENYKKLFLTLRPSSDMKVGAAVSHIMRVFCQLHCQNIMHQSHSSKREWIADALPEVIM